MAVRERNELEERLRKLPRDAVFVLQEALRSSGRSPLEPDGVPGPATNAAGRPAPETGIIVKWNGTNWVDALGRPREHHVKF